MDYIGHDVFGPCDNASDTIEEYVPVNERIPDVRPLGFVPMRATVEDLEDTIEGYVPANERTPDIQSLDSVFMSATIEDLEEEEDTEASHAMLPFQFQVLLFGCAPMLLWIHPILLLLLLLFGHLRDSCAAADEEAEDEKSAASRIELQPSYSQIEETRPDSLGDGNPFHMNPSTLECYRELPDAYFCGSSSSVYFTQDSIDYKLQNGLELDQIVKAARESNGASFPNFRDILGFEYKGRHFSLGNRCLWLFKKLDYDIPMKLIKIPNRLKRAFSQLDDDGLNRMRFVSVRYLPRTHGIQAIIFLRQGGISEACSELERAGTTRIEFTADALDLESTPCWVTIGVKETMYGLCPVMLPTCLSMEIIAYDNGRIS